MKVVLGETYYPLDPQGSCPSFEIEFRPPKFCVCQFYHLLPRMKRIVYVYILNEELKIGTNSWKISKKTKT